MARKNKYAFNAKISSAEFRTVARLFSKDAGAVEIAGQTGLNRNTVNRYMQAMRRRIAESSGGLSPASLTEETLLFGLFTAEGKVRVEAIEKKYSCAVRKFLAGRLMSSDESELERWKHYDGLLSHERCLKLYLNLAKTLYYSDFGGLAEEISLAQDFFVYIKDRMSKFYGIPKKHIFIHLKECEFRYNHKDDNIYNLLLEMTTERPLFDLDQKTAVVAEKK